ncbi:UHRF1 [Branchiostoma lanceolatum]|uniref:RING-type E3 ubiquitin transferase n=1 Tax=Branchiostoma lanceolatum TaxID=7740 RepID=A0A8J9YYI1_BRALA|nr:UHRF1 [Branchiostoma lanceolatum]CAH1244135.1 UHRF1 [Branchiostoma lanceolatum]
MWIQVRTMDGRRQVQIDGLSKLTKIEELRGRVEEVFDDSPADRQRLFYRGKQLEDGHSLFDYSVGLNEIIQLLVRPAATNQSADSSVATETASDKEEPMEELEPSTPSDTPMTNGDVDSDTGLSDPSTSGQAEQIKGLYAVGDLVDARDLRIGAWFEATILKITQASDVSTDNKDNSQGTCESKDHHAAAATTTDTSTLGSSNSRLNGTSDSRLTEDGEESSISADTSPTPAAQSGKGDDNVKTTSQEGEETNGSGESADVEATLSGKDSEGMEVDGLPNGATAEHVLQNGNGRASSSGVEEEGLVYHVKFEDYEDEIVQLRSMDIRPRARTVIPFEDVQEGMLVMANYNPDDPKERGYWYDIEVIAKKSKRTNKELLGRILLGSRGDSIEDCRVVFSEEIFKIEKPGECPNVNINQVNGEDMDDLRRKKTPECMHCLDDVNKKCKHCNCHVCGGKDDPDKQLLCDECDSAFHMYCLTPPMEVLPDDDEWYCPLCRNDTSEIVRVGEKLKESKKKSKMASAKGTSTRDWGKGMACVGRTKVCNLVPPNHFGPIPGVPVGTMWKFRVQASEAGVHRPHVSGIHGRESEGAYSIVLAGGYEDDKDDGEEFLYTGSGGRDLSGNKRTAEQSCDQKLTKMNLALARNCAAPLDTKKGADSKDRWQEGKPVRVLRNCKGRKHSKYAPEDGNRYDGIYKIVKYWPAKGKSGFLVWRYKLRRDDPEAAPWTKEGQKTAKKLGLTMQYPDGYLEAQAAKEKEKEGATPAKGKGKRKRGSDDEGTPSKKKGGALREVSAEVQKMLKEDEENKKLWEEALKAAKGGDSFLPKVEETFLCICCQELVFQPVSTECGHNVCKACLQRSFRAEVYCCPACRHDLGKGYSMATNKQLQAILNLLFPGYSAGR